MTILILAMMWLAGFGFVRWMFPQPLKWSLHNIALFSLSVGTGAGIASCVFFVVLLLGGAGVAPQAWTLGAIAAVALALGFISKRRNASIEWAASPVAPWYLGALFALAAVLAVVMFLGALSYSPHGDDGAWSIWNMKARFLFRAGSFWRDAFSSDLKWTHPDYPLLLPGLVAMCWKLTGLESMDAPIGIAFLFALGTTGLLVAALGALRGKAEAFLGGTMLIGCASFVALSASLYSDVLLSFYILATMALLCFQDRNPQDPGYTAFAGLMAGFAAWTRNEGLIFVIAVLVARVFALFRFGDRSRIFPQLLRFIAGLAAPVAVLITFKLTVAGPGDLQSVTVSLGRLAEFGRWVVTAEGLFVVLLNFGRFILPVILAFVLYWYLVRFRVEGPDRAPIATLVIGACLTLAGQLIADIMTSENLAIEVATSYERMLLQLWPAALLAFFFASGPLQLIAQEEPARGKVKLAKKAAAPKAARPSRSVAETR
jgi:hypothetical protein